MSDPLLAQDAVLRGRRGAVELDPVPARELDGGEADAAGGRVDQDTFAGPRPGRVLDRRVGGEIVQRQGGARSSAGIPSGNGEREVRRGDDQLGVRGGVPVRHGRDPVPDGRPDDIRADGRDDAGDLDTGRVRRGALGAQPGPHVGEVDPDRLGLDQDLARARLRRRRVDDAQHLRAAGPLGHNLPHAASLTRTRRLSLVLHGVGSSPWL